MTSRRQAESAVVIGLDCSTTGTKAIAFDRHGKIVAQAAATIPLYSPKPNYYEQNPVDWWSSTQRGTKTNYTGN